MVKRYILALDQGTTSSRAMLIDHSGQIRAMAQKEFKQIFPQPGWVEHNPTEIWSSQAAVMTQVLAHAGASAEEVAAIGIANQRETTILWDRKTGEPIANAIVWQDRRTTALCKELKDRGLESLFKQKTGLLLDPYFSGTKIAYLLTHTPGALEKAKRGELAFGTVDTWLVWKLTEGKCHVTDASNASRTLLYNIHTGEWDDELLSVLNIPKSILPNVCNSSEVYGSTAVSLLATPIPISGIAGDQQAALFAQCCFEKGMAKTTYGTGCFLLMNTGDKPVASKNNLLTTIAYQIHNKRFYALEGSVFIGGAVVQWLRDNLGIIKSSDEIEALAAKVSDNGGVYFVPAFTGLGAPHWDPYARGIIVGLTRGSSAAHIARAALEAIAFQVADVLDAMQSDAGFPIKELRVDGGAAKDDLLMHFQANLLEAPLLRPKITELTGLGAAFLAGLGVGFWKTEAEIAAVWQAGKSFKSEQPKEKTRLLRQKWNRAIACAKAWEEKA